MGDKHITVNVFADDCPPSVTLTDIRDLLVTNQEKIDAIGASIEVVSNGLTAAVNGLAADIQALKDKVAAGEPLNFAPVDSKLGTLQQVAQLLTDLDAANPPAEPPVVPAP